MKYIPVQQFDGMASDYATRNLTDTVCRHIENCIIKDKKILRRHGYLALGDNLPLSDKITGFAYLELVQTNDAYLIATTKKDTYVYNTGTWDFITKSYNTGTVTVAGVTATVGGGGTWDTGWPIVSYIKFGTNALNTDSIVTTGDTTDTSAVIINIPDTSSMYAGIPVSGTGIPAGAVIATVDAPTQVTLDMAATATAAGVALTFDVSAWYEITAWPLATTATVTTPPAIAAGVPYVIRLCWTGGDDDYHSIETPMVGATVERIAVISNGVDVPQKWDGTGSCEDLGGSPQRGKYLADYTNYLFMGNVIDEGSGDYYPQTVYNSAVGNPEDWTTLGANNYGLFTGIDELMYLKVLSSKLMAYKSQSITEFGWTGDATLPIDYNESKMRGIGTFAGRAVADFGNYHVFPYDDNIYLWDGNNIKGIADGIFKLFLSELSNENKGRCFALPYTELNLYCMFYPGMSDENCKYAFVYNVIDGAWVKWSFPHSLSAAGYYKKTTGYTLDDLIALGWTLDGAEMMGVTLDGLLGTVGQKTYVLGDENGYVYEFEPVYGTDNGTEIATTVITKDYTCPSETVEPRKQADLISEVTISVLNAAPGTMRVNVSTDFGTTWSADIDVPVGGTELADRVLGLKHLGKQVEFKIRNVNGISFTLDSLLIGFENSGLTVGR